MVKVTIIAWQELYRPLITSGISALGAESRVEMQIDSVVDQSEKSPKKKEYCILSI